MSDAKRHASEFRAKAADVRVPLRRGASAPAPRAHTVVELRIEDPWENKGALGGDPYNAVGARIAPGSRPRI